MEEARIIWFHCRKKMSLPRTVIAIASLLASLLLPSLAAAAPYIPPGNSAATQYTETFPTSGGNVEVNRGIGGGVRSHSPERALGNRTAKALEEHGADGAAVAALASESSGGVEAGEGSGNGDRNHGGSNGSSGGGRGGAGGNGGGSGGEGAKAPATGGEAPASSSAFDQVVSRATLSSSGEMGIFLPLVLIAALVCAIAYSLRRRLGSTRQA
jgi:hypothetical protein